MGRWPIRIKTIAREEGGLGGVLDRDHFGWPLKLLESLTEVVNPEWRIHLLGDTNVTVAEQLAGDMQAGISRRV